MRGLELRENITQIKAAALFHLCPGRWASRPGAQWLRHRPDGLQSSWDTKVNCLWSGVGVGHTFSSWNNSFLHALITKLISCS